MARECKLRKNYSIKVQEQRKGWKRMEAVNQKSQRFLNMKEVSMDIVTTVTSLATRLLIVEPRENI